MNPSGKFEIMSEACDQCLVTPQRIVPGSRAALIVSDCRRRDDWFICHKSPDGRRIACRGVEDRIGPSQLHRIMGRLGNVLEIDPQTLEPVQ